MPLGYDLGHKTVIYSPLSFSYDDNVASQKARFGCFW